MARRSSISEIIQKYSDVQQILSVLAAADVFKLFLYADRGLLLSVSFLQELQISIKQYYKALHRLKMLGLLEKKDGIYYHSVSGSILYKRVVQQIAQLSQHQKELKIIDTLKKTGQFSDDEIRRFIEQITKDNNNNLLAMFGGANIITNIVNSQENMVKIVRNRVELANNEILIATRISLDEIIVSLMDSIKRGVKVRILADKELIAKYRRIYYPNMQKSDSLDHVDKHNEERIKLVENPWYQSGVKIDRRIGKVPFGLIIVDRSEVGIELVDSHNPNIFTAGILVKGSSQICDAMLKLYEEMWSNSYPT
jgi:hypothetical protein